MTPLDHNLTRVLYPILCDLAVKAGQAGPMTPARAAQMAAKANSEAVKAAVEEIKRMARVDEGRAHG